MRRFATAAMRIIDDNHVGPRMSRASLIVSLLAMVSLLRCTMSVQGQVIGDYR
jgi:hypothetical protein